MVTIDFANYPGVNMQDPAGLGAAILSDYPTFNFVNGFTEGPLLQIPNHPDPNQATAIIDAFGTWSFDPVTGEPTDSSTVHSIQVNVPGGGYRLVMVGFNVFFNSLESALLNRNFSSLYAGQALEILGTQSYGDTLVGGSQADEIFGYGGDDVLLGGFGNDYVDGMGGRDTMRGGAGNDDYVVGHARDVVDETGGSGIDLVMASVDYRLPNLIEDLTLLDGGGAIDGRGNGLANFIEGNTSNNLLLGFAGNDTIVGYAGADVLEGGDGVDRLIGGDGVDVLRGGAGNDLLFWHKDDTLVDGGAGSDTLNSQGDLNLLKIANDRIVDIERISMAGNGANTLTLSVSDVLALSSETNVLRILGEAADTANIPGSFIEMETTAGYTRYKSGSATLWIDSDIAVV